MATSISEHVNAWIADHQEEVIGWRRHLHRYPELSHMEFATTDFIAETLISYGLSPIRFPTTGLMVDVGPNTEEKVAFRADIDALPISEQNDLDYASLNAGVMHACGHDVHATIALATACALASAELNIGVRVIFQPAEEVMDGGAPDVIGYGALEGIANIFAIHAEPKLKVGYVGVRTGAITSASDVVEVHVTGPGGHSSRPHLTVDVVYALSKLVVDLPGLLSRRVGPRTGTVLVFGSINAGYAPNAIPESGSVTGTIRTADITVWRTMGELLRELIPQVLMPTGCEVSIVHHKGVPPVLNDDVATALLADAARSIDPNAVVQAPQSSGGEDFSWYLEHVPGSMARLGCWDGIGEPGDLHQADILIDERCIAVGVKLFGSVVDRYNHNAELFSQPSR
ncbi:N-acyl-L-amino acid amidohydrolase [Corynebacterium pseudotuberculosis]|uniref:amidohydrolase n=1 Tax=Corynebacterium pseudotuberculosis TaxID=1719 RepID=UPI0002F4265F|nr:amidohydrolase [Corynebacterium pseudotuberculosis]AFH90312.2 amidohydrolase [Corynebacterium pseudotuberculosis 31]APB10441.1 N-acyl-L-amino acid amidohydrolase [Corynebacterium pseudotuberculosis]APB12488.1 N-acyl-L-amino acid amidohydrolase [Corynebacterium pseudotuberculosis]APB14536.1 N-acyl-L-amino acid amidohydrolase [Corynebacterium pseudotuberculosis]APB16581.1 N-acyl-L-amino acid amidohydrolase [Corynebacterium pseudotuberculosis]